MPPTPELCRRPQYRASKCGPWCAPFVRSDLDKWLERLPKRKMWPHSKPTDSFNLVEAPFYAHVPKTVFDPVGGTLDSQYLAVTNQFRKSASPETDLQIEQVAQQAAAFRRNPAWEANGQQVASCEEYVYEKYYDYSRYQDAVAACNGNAACIVKVTYWNGVPGISNRTLKRKDGLPINLFVPNPTTEAEAGDIVAHGEDAPKNAFYRTGGSLMKGIAAKFPAHAHVAALAGELDWGQHYWNSGLPGADRIKHQTDYEYLDFVRKKTAGVSVEEFEELERRTAKIDDLFAKYAEQLSAANVCLMKKDLHPFGSSTTSRSSSGGMSVAGVLGAGMSANLGAIGSGCVGANPSYAIPLVETLAVSPGPEPQLVCPADAPGDTPTIRARNAGCRLVNAVLAEANRAARGGGGCLVPGFYGCDFSPARFVDRYAARDVYAEARAADYDACMNATGGVFTPQPNLVTASKWIHDQQEQKEALEGLKAEAKQIQPGRFGQIVAQEEHWGEPDVFDAKYAAYVGWGLEALEVTKGYADPAKNDVPCRMGGFARAQFKAEAHTIVDPLIDAYSIYNDPAGIPWAQRWNNLANAEGWVTVGELRGEFSDNGFPPKQYVGTPWPAAATSAGWGDTPKRDDYVRAKFHLTLAGEQLFDEYAEIALNQTYTKVLVDEQYKTPKLSASFWVGPVPVTLGVWGTLRYGAVFKATGKAPTTCVYPPALYTADATIDPWTEAEAHAQAGIGIDGIASGGVRGHLVLLKANLPVTAYAALKAQGQNDFAVDLGMKSTLMGRTLDGRLGLYAEALGIEVFEHELFRWSGFSFKQPIFDVKASIPLGGIGFPVE